VDSIPLFRSFSLSLYPHFVFGQYIPQFVVGLLCGKEKPGAATKFLADLVIDACMLIRDGLIVDQKIIKVLMHSVVCDDPAWAFVKSIKYGGNCSCEKYTVHGEYDSKVIFPVSDCPLPTDESFDAMTNNKHYISLCLLKPLNTWLCYCLDWTICILHILMYLLEKV
jgi:hypothetical protein